MNSKNKSSILAFVKNFVLDDISEDRGQLIIFVLSLIIQYCMMPCKIPVDAMGSCKALTLLHHWDVQ